MNILIISVNAIGDTFLSLSAVEFLRETFPKSKIIVLTNSNSKILFEGNFVDEVIFFEKGVIKFLLIVAKLFKKKIYYSFSFIPGFYNSLLLLTIKSKFRSGVLKFSRKKDWFSKEHNFFSSLDFYDKIIWTPNESYLQLVSNAISNLLKNSYIIKKPILLKSEFKQLKSCLIHFSSTEKDRSLTIQQLEIIVKYLRNEINEKILIVGNNEDISEEILEIAEKYDLELLISPNLTTLIRNLHCTLFIGVDSFPLHLADAYNTNFIGLFSKTNPKSVLTNYNKSIKFCNSDFRKLSNIEFEKQIITIQIQRNVQ